MEFSKRICDVRVRVSEEERDRMLSNARRLGLTLSAFIRLTALGALASGGAH